jgi:acyl-CoA thioesterase-1
MTVHTAQRFAVALIAIAGGLLAGCSAAAPARPVAEVGSPAAAPAAGRPLGAVAIGDSIAFGKGVAPDEAWPARVALAHGWKLTDLAVSGSGFVKPGWNGTTYQQQVDAAVRLHPDVVLIAATRNDRDEDPVRLEHRADAMLSELRSAFPHAHIIGITGVWGSDRPPATMTRVDGILEKAVAAVHGTFVDIGFPLVGRPRYLQPDGIHPDAAGQDVVARVVDSKLPLRGLSL